MYGRFIPRNVIWTTPERLPPQLEPPTMATLTETVASLVKRQSSSAPTQSCAPGDDSGVCQKPVTNSSETLPIVLGVVIPIGLAICVLVYLHHRMTKKQKLEDINDKHGSLDFGLDENPGRGKKAGAKRGAAGRQPDMEMVDPEKPGRMRGISMDLGLGSPYILPNHFNGSHDSLHSMSRSIQDKHDPYRPVDFLNKDIGGSSHAYPTMARTPTDLESIHTGGSGSEEHIGSNLLKGARPMSQSFPPRADTISPPARSDTMSPPAPIADVEKPLSPPPAAYLPSARSPPPAQQQQQQYQFQFQEHSNPSSPPHSQQASRQTSLRESRQQSRAPSETFSQPTTATRPSTDATEYSEQSLSSLPSPKMGDSKPLPPIYDDEFYDYYEEGADDFDDSLKVTPPSPILEEHPANRTSRSYSVDHPEPQAQPNALGYYTSEFNSNRLSTHIRPLPPDEPMDTPEQRANRIRSFYREYFDDKKGGPNARISYYEDYSAHDVAGFEPPMPNPANSQYMMDQQAGMRPFAQPMQRRAMTPPPRGPPRMRGPSARTSANSDSRYAPRAATSLSNRGRLPPFAPKKQLPPPKDLMALPTPHMLRDDFAIFNATDFAPPTSFRETQSGRAPDSPRGGELRPYSPMVGSHSPLMSSYDDISALPSPHLLRKSGTFTALDFAPPPKFRGQGDTMSDSGSIRSNRSNRSNISAMHSNALRQGAYRVSRIPTDLVTTQQGLGMELRPQMNLVRPA